MKKLLATLLSVLLIVSVFPIGLFTITATAVAVIVEEPTDIFNYWFEGDGIVISGFKNPVTGHLTIPDEIDGYPVRRIDRYAFNSSGSITSVTIPDSVTAIEEGAFSYCENLTSVTIPASVSYISRDAFSGSEKLETINIDPQNEYYANVGGCIIEITSKTLIKGSDTSVIPSDGSVTSIAPRAFYGCKGLTSIVIPDSVISIEDNAFAQCENLTSISIGRSLNNIGYNAFGECNNIETITVSPENTVYGGGGNCLILKDEKILIKGCKNSVIPNDGSVTSIGEEAFYGCEGLTTIAIPDSVTSVGYCAFSWCGDLETLTIGSSLAEIDEGAFTGCGSLQYITVNPANTVYHSAGNCLIETATNTLTLGCITSVIPDDGSVTVIGRSAFECCEWMESIVIPDSVTTIEEYAFAGCHELNSISIGSSLHFIADSAFMECDKLENVTINPDNPYYRMDSGCVINIETKELMKGSADSVIPTDGSVTKIGDGAFAGSTGLTTITIPNTIVSIGDSAFDSCNDLTEIIIPDSVTAIGSYAFCGCENLESVTFGNSVEFIGEGAFSWCPSLTTVTLPDSLTSIQSLTFYGCEGLTYVNLGNSVTSIGNDAFADCINLTTIVIPDSVTTIGGWAFSNTAFFNDSNNWENGALYLNNHLLKVSEDVTGDFAIKNGTKSIPDYAFDNCWNIGNITIPASLTYIGERAFSNFNGNGEITVDADNPVYKCIDNCLILKDKKELVKGFNNSVIPDDGSVISIADNAFNNTNNYEIVIPDSVTSIGNYAFAFSYNLESLTIGNSVTSIGDYAFGWCPTLNSVEIPDSVTSIGERAFAYCPGLSSLSFGTNVTSIGDFVVESCESFSTIWYYGSAAAFSAIAVGEGNEALLNASIHYNACKPGEHSLVHHTYGGLNYLACENCDYSEVEGVDYRIQNGGAIITHLDGSISGDIILPSTIGGYTVTEIDNWAMSNCNDITSVVIPDTVTALRDDVFSWCENLVSVTVPDSVTSLGRGVFRQCRNLESIDLDPENKAYTISGNCLIETKTGRLLKGLNNSVIPTDGSIISIEDSAFAGCNQISAVVIPDSVTYIGERAFEDCNNLSSLTIGNSVERIGEYAFGWCNSLNSVVLPDSVTTIGRYAFGWCNNLTSVTIPDSVTSIGEQIFDGCNNFGEVWYYGSLEDRNAISIDPNNDKLLSALWHYNTCKPGEHSLIHSVSGSFNITTCENCDYTETEGFDYRAENGGIIISRVDTSVSGEITVPSYIAGCPVIGIGDEAFRDCVNLTNVILPDTVISIGSWAFDNTAFSNNPDNWEDGVLYLGDHLINANGDVLRGSYTVKNGTKTIAGHAMDNCWQLETVILPDSLLAIGDWAFENCWGLTSLTIPASVTSIGEQAFGDCSRLESITVNNGNTVYHSSGNCLIETATNTLIRGCKNSVIPADGCVTSIGREAFRNCRGLKSITIPDTVTYIGGYAFGGCSDLSAVKIPQTMVRIDNLAFANCGNLSSVVIPASVTYIGWAAFDNSNAVRDVWYEGSESDRTDLYIDYNNDSLLSADWHYNFDLSCNHNMTSVYNGDGTNTVSCTECGYYYIEEHDHTEAEAVIENEVPVTCYANGTHEEVIYCSVCGKELSRIYVTVYTHGHIWGQPVTENFIDSTDTTPGSYDEVVYCTRCGEQLSRNHYEIPATGGHTPETEHTPAAAVIENNIPATCTEDGGYDEVVYCDYCGEELSRNHVTVPATGHSPAKPVVENNLPATCTEDGGYDEVVYCDYCGEELSRNHVTVLATGHDYIAIVTDPTCTEEGYTTYTCSVCGDSYLDDYIEAPGHDWGEWEVVTPATCTESGTEKRVCSRDLAHTETRKIPPVGHTSGKAVIENNILPTCTTAGSYDEAFYCSVCSVEVSRNHIVVPANGHSYIYTNNGDETQTITCEHCDYRVIVGVCGDNLTWEFNPSTVTLTISGTGAMSEYSTSLYNRNLVTTAPWRPYYNAIKTVIINHGITNIGEYAFYNCNKIENVFISNTVVSIYSGAFSDCTGLTSITIPDSVTSIGNNAFQICTGLKNITIGSSVISIGNGAFYMCTGLTSVTIPDSVTSIGKSAFSDCKELTDVIIGNGVTLIDFLAFAGCPKLANITIPDSVTSLGEDAFENTAWYNNQPNGMIYAGKVAYNYKGYLIENVTIKEGTKGIADSAFRGRTELKNISIPDSVTTIGMESFYNCENLKSITLPDSLISIGDYAFYDCTGLTSITIPDSVTEIGDCAFFGCTGLTSITIPDSVKRIYEGAFYGCKGLTDVYYNGTQEQWNNIFIDTNNGPLINANIHFSEAHIHEFGEWQVSADATCITDGLKVRTCSCGQEETEIIPATGHSFIYTNSGATQVVTCENCDYLVATGKCGTNATWEYVASTKTLTISGTGAMSEYSCSSYNGSYVTTAPWRPYYNDIKTVIINKGITNVSGYAFFGCEEITKISIPGTVTSMGVAALEECNKITSITIPVSLTSVGVYTFYNCTGIKNVYYLGTEADRSGITFATGNNRLTNATWHYMEAPTDVMSENIGFMNDSIENIAFSEENKYEINFVSAKDITDTKMIELDVYVNGAGFDTGIAIFDSLGNSALYNFTGLKTGWNHLAVRVSDLIEHKDNTSDVNLSNITKCVLSGAEGEEAIIANLYAADYVEGDANRDGEFNLKDIVRAKKMAAGDTEDGNKLAVSGDDYEINAVDLTNLIHSIIDSLFV